MGVKAQTPVDAGVAEDRGALARMVMKLLDHWQLSTEDQAALLGLATSNRPALRRSAAAVTSSSGSGTCSASTRACGSCSRRTSTSPTAG